MSSKFYRPLVLAGDVGATKTNLGIFESTGTSAELIRIGSFPSQSFETLDQLISVFLSEGQYEIQSACFGLPGPVSGKSVRATNLDWEVNSDTLTKIFGFRNVTLVNDLVANAMAVSMLKENELEVLNLGTKDPLGTVGVIAPGTGLGMALLANFNGSAAAISSEGGHASFAPNDSVQVELLVDLWKEGKYVEIESVLSGPGLVTIYDWLRKRAGIESDDPTNRNKGEDRAELISKCGLSKENQICEKALDIFVSILGSVTGNIALTALTTGGIFLGGGI
ncbi:MAG: glucokinase, partial [Pseudomonadota bacterium]